MVRKDKKQKSVAPFAGAWIEILSDDTLEALDIKVAPFAGAWIEMESLL